MWCKLTAGCGTMLAWLFRGRGLGRKSMAGPRSSEVDLTVEPRMPRRGRLYPRLNPPLPSAPPSLPPPTEPISTDWTDERPEGARIHPTTGTRSMRAGNGDKARLRLVDWAFLMLVLVLGGTYVGILTGHEGASLQALSNVQALFAGVLIAGAHYYFPASHADSASGAGPRSGTPAGARPEDHRTRRQVYQAVGACGAVAMVLVAAGFLMQRPLGAWRLKGSVR